MDDHQGKLFSPHRADIDEMPASEESFTPGGSNQAAPGEDSSLFDTTFVVFDLETTGLKAGEDQILEIGAAKVRGGTVLETFSELIDPGAPIPDYITTLTGITDADVADKPQIGTVLPRFFELARNTIWVAHNAKFDLGFLRQASADLDIAWPSPQVVDTLELSRRLIERSKVGRYRLSNLAKFVGSPVRPSHRALDDALATADVLHYLIERLAGHHVETNDQLTQFSTKVPSEIRAKRSLAAQAPHSPGVYIFRSSNGDPLYIGTAVDLRRRLLQYFNGSDSRRKITEMLRLADSIETIECCHGLEAEVREARLISSLRPPYNRQRTEPSRGWYIVAASMPSAPAKISRTAILPTKVRGKGVAEDSAAISLGPFRTKDTATAIRDRFSDRSEDFRTTLTEILDGGKSEIEDMLEEISALADSHRFQRAAVQRDRAADFISTLDRQQRLATLAAIPSLQIAYPDGAGGWHLAEVKYGRLTAAGTAPRGSNSEYITKLLEAASSTVVPDTSIYKGASIDELAIIWKWILRPEVRLKPTGGDLSSPIDGAGKFIQWARDAADARRSK